MSQSAICPTLLPGVSLSSGCAITAILSDVPHFCEGILAIGVFTCLFLTHQVSWLSVFLYGSSFLAFAAATLDLGQVFARDSQNAARAVGFDPHIVAGLIYSREVFLSLSIAFLNLFFWTLVARCPRAEYVDKSSDLSTSRNRKPAMHSASWNQWGLIGSVLKWTSLAALLAVPLMQMVWRLMPGQRKYSSIYVAESTLQTCVTAVFILKFILNVFISPLDYWWHSFQIYFVPIGALVIGVGLGIGNLILFSFTETSLGRLLRAFEVYLLIIHNLYTTFQDFSGPPQASNQPIDPTGNTKTLTEKFVFADTLPYAYANQTFIGNEFLGRDGEIIRKGVMAGSDKIREGDHRPETVAISQASQPQPPSPSAGTILEPKQPSGDRPFTALSLSYYTMDQSLFTSGEYNIPRSLNSNSSNLPKDMELDPSIRFPDSDGPSSVDSRRTITPIDDLLRQQAELEESIANLCLISIQTEPSDGAVSAMATQSRGTGNKSESLSDRSDFSLSVFPAPPVVSVGEVATKYSNDDAYNDGGQKAAAVTTGQKQRRKEVEPLVLATPVSPEEPQKGDLDAKFDPVATRFDVTSFIRDLSGPQRSSQITLAAEDSVSDMEETATITTATINTSGLRPMILASMFLASPSESGLTRALSASTYGSERMMLGSYYEPNVSLRPLFLGKGDSTMSPSVTELVRLAQRRQRGGTINLNTRMAGEG